MKKSKLLLIGMMGLMLLTACTPSDVPLHQDFLADKSVPIVVAHGQSSDPEFYQTGNSGLIFYAITVAANSDINKFLSQYPVNSIRSVNKSFAKELAAKGFTVKVYDKTIDVNRMANNGANTGRNYQALIPVVGSNRLLIITMEEVGAIADYYMSSQISKPKAVCELRGVLIDLRDNKILWRQTVRVENEVKGEWKKPPKYTLFTKTLNETITQAENELLNKFVGALKGEQK